MMIVMATSNTRHGIPRWAKMPKLRVIIVGAYPARLCKVHIRWKLGVKHIPFAILLAIAMVTVESAKHDVARVIAKITIVAVQF